MAEKTDRALALTQAKLTMSLGRHIAGAVMAAIGEWILLHWQDVKGWLWKKLLQFVRLLFGISEH